MALPMHDLALQMHARNAPPPYPYTHAAKHMHARTHGRMQLTDTVLQSEVFGLCM